MATHPGLYPLSTHDDEAFECFFKERTFVAVAKEFKVSNTAVSKHAEKHEWIDRLARRLTKIEERANEKLSDRIARDASRQFDIMSLVEANAVNILKKPKLENGEHVMPKALEQTSHAVETSVKTKRLLAGESTENVAFSYKDMMKRMIEVAAGKVEEGQQAQIGMDEKKGGL